MQYFQLDLLGGFALKTIDGIELALPTRKDRQLLTFLALQGERAQPRQKLASLLWADRAEAQARDSLRQSIAALRRILRSAGADPFTSDKASIALDVSLFAIDAIEFGNGCAASALTAELADLYRGPFLEGMDTSTPDFERWMCDERLRFEELAERLVVVASISVLPPADTEAAMRLGRRLLAQDRTLETVHRAMMRICRASGERAAALKIYASCRAALREDLDVEPDRETEDLYRDILTDRQSPTAPESATVAEVGDRPSIAILPFKNLTGNDRLNFLCEGLAEQLATGLGRFRSILVIDQYSAAAVSNVTSDTTEIGRRLGVSLLVQGSIQATASHLRINVRLVDSPSRAQTWSDVFDCATGEVLDVPDQIATAIIVTIHNRMEHTIVEQSRRNPSLAACECVLRGIKHLRGYAADDNDNAVAMFREALRLDPDHALAQAYLAFAEVVINRFDAAPKKLLLDCKARIDKALAIDPDDGRIHWLLANVHGYLREFDDEKRQLERALAINPNDANARMSYGAYLAAFGQPDEGIAMIREAMRLNPFHPEWYWLLLGSAFLAARRYEDAIEAFKRRTRPMVWVLTRMAICYAHLGRDAEAREMTRQVLEQDPNFRISTLWLGGWSDEDIARMYEGMRLAGLPD